MFDIWKKKYDGNRCKDCGEPINQKYKRCPDCLKEYNRKRRIEEE